VVFYGIGGNWISPGDLDFNQMFMSESKSDKRQFPRYLVSQRCWCETPGTTMYVSMINLSLGGAFVQTALPLAVGQKAVVRWVQDDGSEVEAEARVVWTNEGGTAVAPGMGLRFDTFREGEDSLEQHLAILAS
jgi:Tfp pilus assembly protein PilZ